MLARWRRGQCGSSHQWPGRENEAGTDAQPRTAGAAACEVPLAQAATGRKPEKDLQCAWGFPCTCSDAVGAPAIEHKDGEVPDDLSLMRTQPNCLNKSRNRLCGEHHIPHLCMPAQLHASMCRSLHGTIYPNHRYTNNKVFHVEDGRKFVQVCITTKVADQPASWQRADGNEGQGASAERWPAADCTRLDGGDGGGAGPELGALALELLWRHPHSRLPCCRAAALLDGLDRRPRAAAGCGTVTVRGLGRFSVLLP